MITLINVSVNTTGEPSYISYGERQSPRMVQYAITGTASLAIQGRLTNDMPWVTIATVTASGSQMINCFYQMRAVTSGMAAGTALCVLDAQKEAGT